MIDNFMHLNSDHEIDNEIDHDHEIDVDVDIENEEGEIY